MTLSEAIALAYPPGILRRHGLTAFRHGWQAAASGKPRGDCPYVGSLADKWRLAYDWCKGGEIRL